MRVVRWVCVSVAWVAMASAGCGEKAAPPAPVETPAKAPALDVAGITAKLQGEWRVGSEAKVSYRFAIAGDDVEVTDERFGEPSAQRGKLQVLGKSELGVALADGTVYKYNFVEVEGAMRMGLGAVYEVEDLETFTVPLTLFESLERRATGCRWVKNFGDQSEQREVPCALEANDAGRLVFRYQVPDSFDKTRMADRELFVFGKILIDEELLESIATK